MLIKDTAVVVCLRDEIERDQMFLFNKALPKWGWCVCVCVCVCLGNLGDAGKENFLSLDVIPSIWHSIFIFTCPVQVLLVSLQLDENAGVSYFYTSYLKHHPFSGYRPLGKLMLSYALSHFYPTTKSSFLLTTCSRSLTKWSDSGKAEAKRTWKMLFETPALSINE